MFWSWKEWSTLSITGNHATILDHFMHACARLTDFIVMKHRVIRPYYI